MVEMPAPFEISDGGSEMHSPGDVPPTANHSVQSRKFQIFLSSTFEDLKDERRAVTEVILSMGHIPVGMELFEAGDEDQWSYIQNRIDEVDYYIVIVAERYGSVGPSGLSYTEMEYRYAVEKKIPVAALLLEESKRTSWPQNKVDFANKDKLDDFRTLSKQRMVSYWSDAGSLSSKCQLALNGLFRRQPRTGWISADNAASPLLTTELARLSEENARLREEVARYAAEDRESKDVERAIAFLRAPLKDEFEKLEKKLGDRFSKVLKNEKLVRRLEEISIFDLIMNSLIPFMDGEDADFMESRIKRNIGFEEKDEGDVGFVTNVLFMLMRTGRILEAYDVPRGTGKIKMMRLSDIGRRAFDLAFSRFFAPA